MTRPVPAPRRCALLASAAALALTAQAPAAQAGVFAPDVIDGPSTEIVSAGDVDVARDGTGAVAYLKREAGVPHLYVSRLINGVFLAPERLDPALPAAADQPVVAASDGGRIAVAFVSGAQLNVVRRPNAAAPFQAPQPVADGASNPSIDMSINGVSYVSFTLGGADVRAARLARDGTAFAILPDTIDIEAARVAGDGIRRSQVAVSADGKPRPSGPLSPGTTGAPAAVTVLRASVLLPIFRIASARGPMKMIPAASQASAKSWFSDRKP